MLSYLFILIIPILVGFYLRIKQKSKEMEHIKDVIAYSYKKFYSLMRADRLVFDLTYEQLNNNILTEQDKKRLEKIYSFYVEDSMERVLVAKGYDRLQCLRIYENSSLIQIYKAIKDSSWSLDTLYTQEAALNLAKLIISGYEQQVQSLLDEDKSELLEYFTGYAYNEVQFLENLISLNIPELRARVLYRLSFIHIFGRSSFNDKFVNYDYTKVISELNEVIRITKIKPTNELDIVLTINDKFVQHAAVVISSSLVNSDLDSFYKFHIVMDPKDPLSKESQEKLSAMQYIRNYSIDFTNFPTNIINQDLINKKLKLTNKWPLLVIFRLYLDKLFPHLDSVLYLDSDLVVLQDLTSLKKIDMSDYIAASTMDDGITRFRTEVSVKCNIKNSYKNSGVMFLNLQNMRKMRADDLLSTTLYSSKYQFIMPDQDLFNIAFHHYIYPLSSRWNYLTCYDHYSDSFANFIVHYAGKTKPWESEIQKLWQTSPNKLSVDERNYWRYRALTVTGQE
jgi:lipopolysaccharide biosynthesis glycosyltransferase